MSNQRLAIRYAKSLVNLAIEKNQLEEVYNDIKLIDGIVKTNPDFVAVLKNPIIKEVEKKQIIEAIISGKVSPLTASFISLLSLKGRELNLPEIITSYIEQYNTIKEIHKVKIATAQELSEEMKNMFINKIKSANNLKNIELETCVDEHLVGGFILEMEGKSIDASIVRDLKDVKKQFANNDYIHKLR